MNESFLDLYLDYTKETEPPTVYHRWCALAAVGAILGRAFYFRHGHFSVYPTFYCMLIGEPAARKSTAIRIVRKAITSAGYTNIAADRSSKEKFLVDLQGEAEELFGSADTSGSSKRYDRATAENLWGSEAVDDTSPREVFVTADEFNDFIGSGNIDFCRLLGQLWDYEGTYRSRIKNGRSVAVPEPTVSILGGITPEDFALTFPTELIGQGFMSRLILVHGERSGKKISFPEPPSVEKTEGIKKALSKIKAAIKGEATITVDARRILDEIYNGWPELSDIRFRHYSNRRFTQLLKITLVCTAANFSTEIKTEQVILANTILSAAEVAMPTAIGEFGKSKHSDVANKIMALINTAAVPVGIKDLWKQVHKDLEKPQEMAIIIQSLEQADKIHHVKTYSGTGWLPKVARRKELRYVDWNLLTAEERREL